MEYAARELTTFDKLSSEQIALGRAALAEHLGDEKAGEPGWLRRLAFHYTGKWLVGTRRLGDIAGQFHVTYRSIPEAVALLAKPNNSDAAVEQEMEERAKHRREQKIRDDELAAKKKIQDEADAVAKVETDRLAAAFDGVGWHGLHPMRQLLYSVALALKEESPAAAQKLRDIAAGTHQALKPGELPIFRFPGVEWKK